MSSQLVGEVSEPTNTAPKPMISALEIEIELTDSPDSQLLPVEEKQCYVDEDEENESHPVIITPRRWLCHLLLHDLVGLAVLLGLCYRFSGTPHHPIHMSHPLASHRPDVITFATGVLSLIFVPLTWCPWISRECLTVHLLVFGVIYCAFIHIGIPMEHIAVHRPRTAYDTLVNAPLLLFAVPLFYHYGSKHTLRTHLPEAVTESRRTVTELAQCLGPSDSQAFADNYTW